MALKFKYESKDAVPAEHAGLYVEREEASCPDVDGAVEKAKLEEFRATNVELMKERDELKRRFERSDSEAVRAVAAERDALNARLAAIQIDQAVVTEATRRGLRGSGSRCVCDRMQVVQEREGPTSLALRRGGLLAETGGEDTGERLKANGWGLSLFLGAVSGLGWQAVFWFI
jgi:hypothetical protein